MPNNQDTAIYSRQSQRYSLEEPEVQLAPAIESTRRYVAERAANNELETIVQQHAMLLAQLAHDLKNPVSVIIAFAHMLRQHVPEERSEQDNRLVQGLDQIEAAAARIADHLDRAVEGARVRAGGRELERMPVDLAALVRQVVDAAQHTTSQHTLRMAAAAPELIGRWDAVLLELLFENLLANAIKYSPNGGDVTVTLERDVVAGTPVALAKIQDHGIGIPSSDLPHIFDPFRRGHNVGSIAGKGLGLASARRIARQHDGSLAVESELGRGTTAIVRLPLLGRP